MTRSRSSIIAIATVSVIDLFIRCRSSACVYDEMFVYLDLLNEIKVLFLPFIGIFWFF